MLNTRSTNTGAPQGCVLSPLLFPLYTNDCISTDPSVKLQKSADDTTLIGLIKDRDESAYRQEDKELAVWCSLNNLELNMLKTVDFRRTPPPCTVSNHHHRQHCACSGHIKPPPKSEPYRTVPCRTMQWKSATSSWDPSSLRT